MSDILGKIVGALILAAILIIPSLYVITYISNNITCSRFSKQLTNLDLPSGTSIVETKQIVSKLVGNGNSIYYNLHKTNIEESKKLEIENSEENIDNKTVNGKKANDYIIQINRSNIVKKDKKIKIYIPEITFVDYGEELELLEDEIVYLLYI